MDEKQEREHCERVAKELFAEPNWFSQTDGANILKRERALARAEGDASGYERGRAAAEADRTELLIVLSKAHAVQAELATLHRENLKLNERLLSEALRVTAETDAMWEGRVEAAGAQLATLRAERDELAQKIGVLREAAEYASEGNPSDFGRVVWSRHKLREALAATEDTNPEGGT